MTNQREFGANGATTLPANTKTFTPSPRSAASQCLNSRNWSPENGDEETFGRLGVEPNCLFVGQGVQIAGLQGEKARYNGLKARVQRLLDPLGDGAGGGPDRRRRSHAPGTKQRADRQGSLLRDFKCWTGALQSPGIVVRRMFPSLNSWKGGHEQECKTLQEERRQRVYAKMVELDRAKIARDTVKMEEERVAVASELRSTGRPAQAALIYSTLGEAFCQLSELVKALGLLDQARALAMEGSEPEYLMDICNGLANYYKEQFEHEKAIEHHESARAIAVAMGDRQSESVMCGNLALSCRSSKQYDRAIALFEQAMPIDEELGNRSGRAKRRVGLGCCLVRAARQGYRKSHAGHDRQPGAGRRVAAGICLSAAGPGAVVASARRSRQDGGVR